MVSETRYSTLGCSTLILGESQQARSGGGVAVTAWTGVEVHSMRTAAMRITQAELAERLGFTESVVRKWEKRGATITLTNQHAAAMDTLLARLDDDQHHRFESACSEVETLSAVATSADPFGRPDAVVDQLQHLAELRGDGDLVDGLSLALGEIVGRYETEGPRHLAGEVQELRQRVNLSLQQRRHPAHVVPLYRVSARLSGVLAYMAVNCGRFGSARMYCREAQVLASLIEDREMLAWVKSTESFCAYYAGDFVNSVKLAEEGDRAGWLRVSGNPVVLRGQCCCRRYPNAVGTAKNSVPTRPTSSATLWPCRSTGPDADPAAGPTERRRI